MQALQTCKVNQTIHRPLASLGWTRLSGTWIFFHKASPFWSFCSLEIVCLSEFRTSNPFQVLPIRWAAILLLHSGKCSSLSSAEFWLNSGTGPICGNENRGSIYIVTTFYRVSFKLKSFREYCLNPSFWEYCLTFL